MGHSGEPALRGIAWTHVRLPPPHIVPSPLFEATREVLPALLEVFAVALRVVIHAL
jgi:hypothetical protein